MIARLSWWNRQRRRRPHAGAPLRSALARPAPLSPTYPAPPATAADRPGGAPHGDGGRGGDQGSRSCHHRGVLRGTPPPGAAAGGVAGALPALPPPLRACPSRMPACWWRSSAPRLQPAAVRSLLGCACGGWPGWACGPHTQLRCRPPTEQHTNRTHTHAHACAGGPAEAHWRQVRSRQRRRRLREAQVLAGGAQGCCGVEPWAALYGLRQLSGGGERLLLVSPHSSHSRLSHSTTNPARPPPCPCSDPKLGNTDDRIEVGDKVVSVSASFGDDIWEARNFGQVRDHEGALACVRGRAGAGVREGLHWGGAGQRTRVQGSTAGRSRVQGSSAGRSTAQGRASAVGWRGCLAGSSALRLPPRRARLTPAPTPGRCLPACLPPRWCTPSRPATATSTCASSATSVTCPPSSRRARGARGARNTLSFPLFQILTAAGRGLRPALGPAVDGWLAPPHVCVRSRPC